MISPSFDHSSVHALQLPIAYRAVYAQWSILTFFCMPCPTVTGHIPVNADHMIVSCFGHRRAQRSQ
jgi:hypothetical protein